MGFPDVDDGEKPKSLEGMSTNTMWKRYVNQVKLTPLTLARPSKWQSLEPLHYELNAQRNPVTYNMIQRKAKLPMEQIQQQKRAVMTKLDDQNRRIEQSIRRMHEQSDDIKEIANSLMDVTVGSKQERENERMLEAQKAARIKFQGLTGSRKDHKRKAIAGDLYNAELQIVNSREKPPLELLKEFFNDTIVDPEERKLREIAKRHNIGLIDASNIKEHFVRYDADGSGAIDKQEFREVVRELLLVGKAKNCDLAESVVDQFWVQADFKRTGEIEFEDFLCWFYFSGVYASLKGRE